MNTKIDMSPYFNMLEDYENKIKSTTSAFTCGGIYGIYAQQDGVDFLIYVGKSAKDVAHRIASHYTNMNCPLSKEYTRQFYQTLRYLVRNGFHLEVRLLRRLEEGENINKLEAIFQENLWPPLCEKINGYFAADGRDYRNPHYFFRHHPLCQLDDYILNGGKIR